MLNICLETTRIRRRCTCPHGHSFSTEILISIDIDRDLDQVNLLDDEGRQLISCPICGKNWQIAEPIFAHNSAGNQFALFVPDCLSHRQLDYRVDLLKNLSANDEGDTPTHALQFETIIGFASLLEWTNSENTGNDGKTSDEPNNPRIHKAFADLISIVPDPPDKNSDD